MLAKTTWGAAEYALMASALEPVSALVIDAAAVSAEDRVIDVGTGTGNAALEAAARGASVLAIDFEPALLELARDRARAAATAVEWVEGDAEALPAPSGQADVVVSVFGVVYALDHARAARELVRVLAPSGRIALAAWTPGSFMPAIGTAVAPYLPPAPAGSAPPSRWGDADFLKAVLHAAGARLTATSNETLTLKFHDAPDAVDFLIRTAGHIISQQQQLTDEGRWLALCQDLEAFVNDQGKRADGIELELEYLIATATRG